MLEGNETGDGAKEDVNSPVVTEASGHHSEGASQTGLSPLSVVAPNRKPTASRKSGGIVRASVNEVNSKIRKYQNNDYGVRVDALSNTLKDLGKMFGMRYKGRSRYATYEVKLGNITLRLSEHNANGANFANDPEGAYVSVYVEGVTYPHKKTSIPYTEIRYPKEVYLQNPRGVADEIVSGVKSLLEKGDFETALGLGEKKIYPVEVSVAAEDAAYYLIVSKRSGETLGWYSPATKEIHLNPGADAETLMHETLHAVQDWAKENSPKLAAALDKIAKDCPRKLKQRIIRAYGTVSAEAIMKEWGAFNRNGSSWKRFFFFRGECIVSRHCCTNTSPKGAKGGGLTFLLAFCGGFWYIMRPLAQRREGRG